MTLTLIVGLLNLGLGAVYTNYGTMTVIELRRGWRARGFSHFGAAWILMAFTCGPAHLVHASHLLFEGRTAGTLDLLAVGIGVPAGVTWFALRLEAFAGGRGDRFIHDTPWWVPASAVVAVTYALGMLVAMGAMGSLDLGNAWIVVPNILLVGLYCMVGYYLLRTQVANRGPLGGWSLSGLALSVIFPTCAAMHGVFAYYVLAGRYGFDVHGFAIAWLAVPAAAYFLWVVRSLYEGRVRDWNSNTSAASRREVQPAPAQA